MAYDQNMKNEAYNELSYIVDLAREIVDQRFGGRASQQPELVIRVMEALQRQIVLMQSGGKSHA